MVPRLPLLLFLCLTPGLAFALGPAERPSLPPIGWVVDAADVTVHFPAPTADDPGGEPTIEIAYTFRRLGHDWATVRLADGILPRTLTGPASREVDDGPFVVHVDALSLVHLNPALDVTTARLTGYLAADAPDHALVLLPPAARTLLHIDAPGLDVDAAGSLPAGNARLLPADGRLDLSWRPHVNAEPEPESRLVRAESSTAAWAQDGALNVRSRIRFIVTRGSAESLSVDVSGLDEIEVEGPVEHTLSGTTLVLTPAAPLEGMLTVELTGRRASVSGPFPSPRPLDVTRHQTWYTLGKPDEGDVVPSGGASVSARQLPIWARGVSDAAPVAYWSTPPNLTSGEFEALLGPDTIVQSAEYVVTQSEDGHVLARATWLVRNERSQYLKVTPPKGYVPLTARVSGRPALLLHEGADYFVPLEKSIETVQGLLAFPVEVAWIGTDATWADLKHSERNLQLPAVDAPIQAASWEVHLPRGWKVDGKQHTRRSVPAPAAPPLDPAKEQAREAWTNAIESYKKNDFKDAQRWLDASRGYAEQTVQEDAATMDNVGRLQSNLDVLLPAKAEKAPQSTEDDLLARRVRDLANAKTMDAQITQSKLEEDARKALLAGDDEKAAAALEEVTKLAKDIGITEQKESNEQADKLSEYSQALAATNERVSKKAKTSSSAGYGKGSGSAGGVAGGTIGGVVSGSLGGIGISGTGEGGGGQSFNGGEDYDGDALADEIEYGEPYPEEPELEESRYRAEAPRLTVREEEPMPEAVETDRRRAEPMKAAERPSPKPDARVGGKSESVNAYPVAPPPPPPPASQPVASPIVEAPAQGWMDEAAVAPDDDGVADRWQDTPADAEPVTIDTEQASQATTTVMTNEFLSKVPTGRSYQSALSSAAGVVAPTPSSSMTQPTNQPSPRANAPATRVPVGAPAAAAGRSTPAHAGPSPSGEANYEDAGSLGYLDNNGPTWTQSADKPKVVERKPEDSKDGKKDVADESVRPDPATGTFSSSFNYEAPRAGQPQLPTAAERAAIGHRLSSGAPEDRGSNENTYILDGVNTVDPVRSSDAERIEKEKQKVELKHELDEQRRQAAMVKSRTRANRNVAPDTRERRSALLVEASPLTPALPLDGARVDHSAALLDAGEFPTFAYTVSPDPKSDTFKE